MEQKEDSKVLIFDVMSFKDLLTKGKEFKETWDQQYVRQRLVELHEGLVNNDFKKLIAIIPGNSHSQSVYLRNCDEKKDIQNLEYAFCNSNSTTYFEIKYMISGILQELGFEVHIACGDLHTTLANFAAFYKAILLTQEWSVYRFQTKGKNFLTGYTKQDAERPFQVRLAYDLGMSKEGKRTLFLPDRLTINDQQQIQITKERTNKLIIKLGRNSRAKKIYVTSEEVSDETLLPTVQNLEYKSLLEYNFKHEILMRYGISSQFDRSFGENTPQKVFQPLRQILFSHLKCEGKFKELLPFYNKETKKCEWKEFELEGLQKNDFENEEILNKEYFQKVIIKPNEEQQKNPQSMQFIRMHNTNMINILIGYVAIYRGVQNKLKFQQFRNINLTKENFQEDLELNLKMVE